ncbi:MAG: alpha/beta fold hydrolase [Terriglobales bacterium]
MPAPEPFSDPSVQPTVRGYLHRPGNANDDGLVLSHGAGSNAQAPMLIALAEKFSAAGFTVLRCDLPFRQARPHGPPGPGDAARDRAGLKNAIAAMRKLAPGRIFLGGHSYGGRQSTMLCSEEPSLVDGLLLLSYPLHPPRKPEQLRTQHFPKLTNPSLFVHGTRDPFASDEEIRAALKLIPAKTKLLSAEGAGHDLNVKKGKPGGELIDEVVSAFWDSFRDTH